MPSEPTPTPASCIGVTCHICGQAPAAHKVEEAIFDDDPNLYRHPLTAYACRTCFAAIMHPRRVGGAAPSAPTTDAPTDPMRKAAVRAAILLRALWAAEEYSRPVLAPGTVDEIKGIVADIDAALLRGGATTWPALDFDACRRLYADLHEALAQYGDPDDANRVRDFNRALREHLTVSRGGATAPTPDDPTRALADALGVSQPAIRRWSEGKNLPHRLLMADLFPVLIRALLRRDTGASHE